MNTCRSSVCIYSLAAGLTVACLFGSPALGVVLPPGGTVSLSGVPGGSGPGVVIHDELIPFEIRGAGDVLLFTGALQDRVVRLDATGTLSFEYRIRTPLAGATGRAMSAGEAGITDLATADFSTFFTDVDFSTTSLGTVGPARARRSAGGDTVIFDFTSQPVIQGIESRFVHIVTEATAFEDGGLTTLTLSTGESVSLRTVVPVRGVGCREIDFEDLPLGTAYPHGSFFAPSGVLIRVEDFFFGPGLCINPFTDGFAEVQDGGSACGSGNELLVGNVNLSFHYGIPIAGLVLRYGEYGGNVNLEVNGACFNVDNFADLPGMIGGVAVSVIDEGEPGQGCGRLILDGMITSFRIGGQELWIDDVLCRRDPCAEDETPPVAELTSPPSLTCVCDPVEITGTADDDNFDRYILEYRRPADAAWNLITTSTTTVVNGLLGTWNTAGLPQGYYLIRLTVRDQCGHSETAVNIVWLGTEFDNLTVRSPEPGGVYGGDVCFDGTVTDNFCFRSYVVEYQPAGGGAYQPVDSSMPVYTSGVINDPFATWHTITAGVPDGSYNVRVFATDDCGNTASDERKIIVDNTPPIAVITDPQPCAYVEGKVNIRGTANDAHLSSWVVQYTGGDAPGWVTIASGNQPVINGKLASWDTSELRACAYTLRLVVTDEAIVNCNAAIRHRSEYTVSVNVGNCGDFDTDDDGDVDLYDYSKWFKEFTGP